MNTQFHVFMRGRNCAEYASRCLESLYAQTYKNWTASIWLDDPKDNSIQVVSDCVNRLGCFQTMIVQSPSHYGLCKSMYRGLKCCIRKWQVTRVKDYISPETVIGNLDLDDWLAPNALEVVNKIYETKLDTLLTYGSFIEESVQRRTCVSQPYPKGTIVRHFHWRASHFKTFKLKLFNMLTEDCFHDENGCWLKAASDMSLMIPMMEMAGLDKCVHIPEEIYHWRDNTEFKTNVFEQEAAEKIIRAKKPFERISL